MPDEKGPQTPSPPTPEEVLIQLWCNPTGCKKQPGHIPVCTELVHAVRVLLAWERVAALALRLDNAVVMER
ncbi:MAG: hypothetical protein LC623_09535 [Halobacteriales archaeon]|nr:hypothetical protein [Halobacteriales archaeon]